MGFHCDKCGCEGETSSKNCWVCKDRRKHYRAVSNLKKRLKESEAVLYHAEHLLNDLKMAWGSHYPATDMVWMLEKALVEYARKWLK